MPVTSRSQFLAAAAAASSVAAASGVPAQAQTASSLSLETFLQQVRSNARHRQSFGSPRVHDGAILRFITNSLAGFQDGWKEPADSLAMVAVLFGSGAALAVDDAAWRDYALREVVTGFQGDFIQQPGEGNPYKDQIAGLQRRGVRFYACTNAVGEVARRAAARPLAPLRDGNAVFDRFRGALLPGIALVPAGVSAIAALQEVGYSYFFAGV